MTDSHTSRPGTRPSSAAAAGVTSASRSGAACTSRRTASPCGATSATGPCQRSRGEPSGSLRATTTTASRGEGDQVVAASRTTLSPTSRATWSVRGPLRDLGRRADLGHPSLVEHQHPVGQRQRVDGVVGDQQGDAVVVARCRPSSIRSAIATATSRPVKRLVEQQHAGSVASARAIATRCAWPPESSRGLRSARSPMPKRSSQSRATRVRLARLRAAGARTEGDVVQGGQVGEQQLALEDQADAAVAGGEREQVGAAEPRAGPSPATEPGERAHQGRLPGAVGPDHRQRPRRPRP